jgi:signal transduction histidine kinase
MRAIAQFRGREEPFDPVLLMAALDACPESVAVVEKGRIIYAGRAFGTTLNFSSGSDLRGRLLMDLLPESTRYLDQWETPCSLDSGPVQIEASVSDFQENQRTFQVICIRPVPQSKHVPRWESQKMETIGRLSAGIAHDFNNLLTGIMLYSDLLIAGLEEDCRLRRHAEAIRKAGTNGVSLVQQLMTPARKQAMAIQLSSWNHAVSETASLLIRLVGENIELETKLSETAGLVKIGSGQMQQIILNLALNAKHAMPMGGKITISTRNCAFRLASSRKKGSQPTPCVEFVLTDTGRGMDKKTLAQVFRPFFTTKPRNEGNGLGLTISGHRQARGWRSRDRKRTGKGHAGNYSSATNRGSNELVAES